MKKYLFLPLLVLACTQVPSKVEQLDSEVMKLHDEAMAKSSMVLLLKKTINHKIDSITNITSKDSLQIISSKLYKADRMMLDWMHQYNTPNFNSDTAEKYLNTQLIKIRAVHEITFESIKEAKAILNYEN